MSGMQFICGPSSSKSLGFYLKKIYIFAVFFYTVFDFLLAFVLTGGGGG